MGRSSPRRVVAVHLAERDAREQQQRADLDDDHDLLHFAESSVPTMQIAVITTMIATASPITAPFEPAAPSQPTSR